MFRRFLRVVAVGVLLAAVAVVAPAAAATAGAAAPTRIMALGDSSPVRPAVAGPACGNTCRTTVTPTSTSSARCRPGLR
ncbi:hypothetical protein, partial [Kutzneria kofuensis]|uniref:hypothetical protein n=1 Tax=Kutzneria kofuensis TaxID=103725 RepID=UPI0031E65ED6